MIERFARFYLCQRNRFHKNVFRFIGKHFVFFSLHFPKTFLKYYYWNWVGVFPDFKEPKDINQYLLKSSIMHKNDMLRAQCADKYAVRKYVEDRLGNSVLVKCLGVYDKFSEIDFDNLPEAFVMKMTNASGRNFICLDKKNVDYALLEEKFDSWMKDSDFGVSSGEWQYSHIKPRIIIEEYLSEFGEKSVIDYKFHCFNGNVASCLVAFDRDSEHPHSNVCLDDYDLHWNRTGHMKEEYNPTGKLIPRPHLLDDMVSIASSLSKGLDYVRVDLYDVVVDGAEKVLFGELTFTPNGNVMSYYKQEYLDELGELYRLYNN